MWTKEITGINTNATTSPKFSSKSLGSERYLPSNMASSQSADLLNDSLLSCQGLARPHRDNRNHQGGTFLHHNQQRQLPHPPQAPYQAHHSVPEQNVTVEVSGSRFCIVPDLFQKVENLKWKTANGLFKLNANPDVFEMLLKYFLFNTLPDTKSMSHRKATELMELAAPLDPIAVFRLCQHLQSGLLQGNASSGCDNPNNLTDGTAGGISSAFLKRSLSGFSSLSSRSIQLVPRSIRRANSVAASSNAHHARGTAAGDDQSLPSIPSHINMSKQGTHPMPSVVSTTTTLTVVAADTIPSVSTKKCTTSTSRSKSASSTVVFDCERESCVPKGQQYPTLVKTFGSSDSSSEGSISKLSQYSPVGMREVHATAQHDRADAGSKPFPIPSTDGDSPSGAVVDLADGVAVQKSIVSATLRPTLLSTSGEQDQMVPELVHQQHRHSIPSAGEDLEVVLMKHFSNNISDDSVDNHEDDRQKKKKKKKNHLPLHQRRSTKLIRSVLKGGGKVGSSDRSLRKMTHADWCSSEYVL